MADGVAANGRGTGTRVLALVMVVLVATSSACTIVLPVVGAGVGRTSAPAATTSPGADPACADGALAATPACASVDAQARAPQPAPRSRYGAASTVGAFLGFFAGLAIDVWIVTLPARRS
jgi:hypothetical protein